MVRSHHIPAAQRVPPELFPTIIEHSTPTSFDLMVVRPDMKRQLKQQAGRCSLVCRYWAKHCRVNIFDCINIQAYEDMQCFLAFVATTTLGISIRSYVRRMYVHITLPSTSERPWIHHIMAILPRDMFPQLQCYQIFVLSASGNQSHPTYATSSQIEDGSLSGSHSADVFMPRSILHNLPRALPVRHSPLYISLNGHRFATFSDMVAFLSSNPDPQAETLRLDAVSWDNHDELKPEQTPAPFHRPSRRPRRRFQEITTTSGTPVWPLVWLLAAIHPGAVRTTPQLYIDAAELRRLATMVHTVADCCACAECGGTPEETYLYVRPLGASISDRSVLTVCGVLHDWHLVFGIAAGLVTDITLDLAKPLSSLKLACEEDFADLGLDWAALDGQARAFDMSLAYFAVRVPESAYDCDGYLRAHLPKTQACGKLEVMVMPTTRDKGKQRAVGP